ncbi:MAG: hypothetical protein ACOX6O_01045 [Christensenellales bacterium]
MMNKYEIEILILLKNAFDEIAGVHTFQCDNENQRHAYYLTELDDNLYKPMSWETRNEYERGNGKELNNKMRALRSSAALTYNLFWNRIAKFKDQKERNNQIKEFRRIGEGVYVVEFEKKYRTLKTTEANLDAFLYSRETHEAVACEIKMLEWILNSNKSKELSKSYLCKEKYIDENAGEIFSDIASKFIKNAEKKITENFDAFQMFKHTSACYAACFDKNSPKINKLTLVNCVWTLSTPKKLGEKNREEYLENEKQMLAEFKFFKQIIEPVKALFNKKGVDFDIVLYTLNDFIALLEKDENELKYLKRYTQL